MPGLLKNRKHLVVSRQEPLASYKQGNEAEVRWFKSTGELVADYLCFENQDRDLWIIGGAELYREAIHWNCLDGIVLTTLLDTVPDDPTNVKFPEFDDEEFYLTDHVLIEQGETKLKIVLLLKPEHEGNVIEENFFTVCRAVKELAKTQPTLYTFK